MRKILHAFLAFVIVIGLGTIQAQTLDFEDQNIGDTFGAIGWGEGDLVAEVADDPLAAGNNVLKCTVNNYNAAPVLEVTLPAGKTLADYSTFAFKGYFAQGDVGWKDIVVEANQTMPAAPDVRAYQNELDIQLGSWNRAMGGSAAWENITIDITNNSDLSGTIYLSFGINCSGTGDVGGSGVTTIWYADDIELVAPAGGKVSDWGITDRGDGWPILNTEETPAGNGSIGSDEPLTAWATLRGSFGEALEATTEQAFVVQGQLEYAGAGTNDSYVGLRYALTLQADTLKNPDEGTLENQYSDSAKWVGGGVHYGYEFTPQSGTTVMANGAGGAGTTWIVNGGSGWNSTWSNNGYPIAAVEPAPRRASIEEGVYDWAISVQPLGDGTNEIRWYMMHEDETYWFGGTTIDTAQVATKFNGVAFGIGDDLPPELTEFKLMDVTYRLGDPIKVPEAPFSSFYVADWGAAGYEGWPILNDSTTLDGNAGMGADGPPDGWASLRGSFGTDVKATTEEAIIVEGKIEWVGGDCGDSYIPIRYALTFQADSLMNPAEGTLENQYTDSARWVDGGNHFGYSFMPVTGAGTMSNGGGGAGTNWIINNGNWVSTWSNNGYPIAAVKPAPRLAEITEGVYEFAISVQPLGNGTNEIRWYLVDENMESYWYAGSAIDTAQVTTQFNGVEFGLTGEHLDEITGLNVMDVKVDKGEPITVPPRIFQSFYVADWGLTNRGDGWPMLNDSTTLDGNAGMGSNEPLTAWTTMRGEFGTVVEATTEEAMIITGQMEYEGAGTGDSYVGLRYALTLQADTLKNPLEGTLENQYTDSAKWVAENAVHYGYEFTPVSGATVMANGAGGGGTTWIINGGGGWNSTWSNNGYPIAAVAPAPRRASITEGVYDWAISVQPLGDGTNEIRWYMVKEDTSYWFGGTTIDTAQVTTRFNTINFGIGDDLPAELTAFNVRDVKVDRGDPITVPAPPWEAFYLADWGFIGDRFGGWTLTPGELDGNVTISGEEAPSDWAAVRGGFGLDVMPTEEDALVIEGSVEFAGGGFEDWSSFRFGMFYSDSAGTIDSTETNGYAWNGTEDHHSGYLFLPLSGDAAPVDWQGIGETGTYGAVVDRPWMSTNGANDYVLGSTMPVPAGAVAGAGTYNFELSVQPIEGGMDVRFKLVKDDESYFFQDIATDTHDPVATEKFNCVAFAINNSTTTAMNITDVRVDMGDPIEVPVSVESDEQAELPQEYALNQNYPNPFNPSTTIEFALPKSGKVNLVVYDIMGRTVANLVQDSMEAGHHKITFDASKLTSGVYFYKLSAGDFTETKKFMLLK